MAEKKKIILIDMDGTIADFSGAFIDRAIKKGYQKINDQNIKSFGVHKLFVESEESRKLISEKNFYRNLKPIDGATEAVKEMFLDESLEVYFCTSPLTKSDYCVHEK